MTQDELVEQCARAMCVDGGFDPDEIMPNDGPRWCVIAPAARAIIPVVQAEQQRDAVLPVIGQEVCWVGPDGDMRVRCKVVSHVEGWIEVEFSDHSPQHYSRAIVRPSSLVTRIDNVDAHLQQIQATAIRNQEPTDG